LVGEADAFAAAKGVRAGSPAHFRYHSNLP